jgi:putative spermidine/putrescine transport system permease protein
VSVAALPAHLGRAAASRRRPRRDGWITAALLAPGCGFLLIAISAPLGQLLLSSVGLAGLGSESGFTLAHYRRLLDEPMLRDSFLFSLTIAAGTTLASLAAATLLTALLLVEFPGRRLVNALYKIPLVMPSLIAGFLVLTVIGPGGMAARLVDPLGFGWPVLVHDRWGLGIILVLMWHHVPTTMLIMLATIVAIPRDIVDAARNLGAGPVAVFGHIILPLAWPGLSAAALLVFIDGFGSYAVPSLIGPAYPQAIAISMTIEFLQRAHWGAAAAIGTVMVATTAIVLLAYDRLLGGGRRPPR